MFSPSRFIFKLSKLRLKLSVDSTYNIRQLIIKIKRTHPKVSSNSGNISLVLLGPLDLCYPSIFLQDTKDSIPCYMVSFKRSCFTFEILPVTDTLYLFILTTFLLTPGLNLFSL